MFPDFKKPNRLGMFLYDKFAVNWGVAAPFQQADCSFFYPCPCFSLLHVTMHRHAPRGLFLTSNLAALHWHFYFELFILYWGVANWKSHDGFRWTAKEDSATHTHVSILPQTPLQSRLPHNTGHSSTCYTVGPGLLSIHFRYSSVHMKIPNFLTVPSPWQP